MDQEILALRSSADHPACRVIAERLKISEGRVWACLRRHHRTHEYRAAQPKRERIPPSQLPFLEGILREFGEITLEEGVGGGYIATIGDWTGNVRETITEAVQDAMDADRPGQSRRELLEARP